MSEEPRTLQAGIEDDAALAAILQGTASRSGESFFAALVTHLAQVLDMPFAWMTKYLPETRKMHVLAMYLDGETRPGPVIPIASTPCEAVLADAERVYIREHVQDLFPRDNDLGKMGMESYLGVPLLHQDGRVLGHLAIMDREILEEEPRSVALFQIFAARAAAEMQRLSAEDEVRSREEKLAKFIDSVMDAFVELDEDLVVTQANGACEKIFGCSSEGMIGRDFRDYLLSESRGNLEKYAEELMGQSDGERHLWVPGGLHARDESGRSFPAEATLCLYDIGRVPRFALILRNVNDRKEAERRIKSLTRDTDYLREEIRSLRNFDTILGESEALLKVLRSVRQVAETDATVLIYGETGTGKELIARAIHALSSRGSRPMIRVNCAAIPANLMESELFGHEAGAFTGATRRREGRFALADGSTLFLDEIGELPLDLQSKLLRVLQEGEFEPVGSSRTRKADVRVIAATNRELKKEAENGRFREDLYYRLNVFPINVPPLRERIEDIPVLARAFAEKYAKSMGRTVDPLTAPDLQRLQAYDWPGNVRELQNVIERAVITSQRGGWLWDALIPMHPGSAESSNDLPPAGGRILTSWELRELEKANIERALDAADGKVSGKGGAAELLGMKPSTLSSRIKALGIRR